MTQLVQLGKTEPIKSSGPDARRPAWLRVKVNQSKPYAEVGQLLNGLNLNTVCEEARCPNIWECWGEHRTATFMILGDICTRACRYCSVTSGRPSAPPDPAEPDNIAEAVDRLSLSHAVLTSVDRDDLTDYGSGHWAATINAIRKQSPKTRIEGLIPDFMGHTEPLQRVLDAHPDVLDHNIETVPRLFSKLRSKGDYERSLELLGRADAYRRQHTEVKMTTKSGLMVGLGETIDEVFEVMDALRRVHCDVLTVGQYLNPTKKHAAIHRFYTPEEFAQIKEVALTKGFLHCESGPLVRSSYHAHEHVAELT